VVTGKLVMKLSYHTKTMIECKPTVQTYLEKSYHHLTVAEAKDIEIPNITRFAFELMMRFIYTGKYI
jgi:hypothetical protein